MVFETYKDLRIGDRIKYENVRAVMSNKLVSGEGEIIGFGDFGMSIVVWIKNDETPCFGVPYEKAVKKT